MFACKLAEIAIKHPSPEPEEQQCGHNRQVEMKTALILLSALTSLCLSRPDRNNFQVSFTEGRTAGGGGASTRFFWCQIYQGNCVSGCSGNSNSSHLKDFSPQ